jgi:hypothetical protein
MIINFEHLLTWFDLHNNGMPYDFLPHRRSESITANPAISSPRFTFYEHPDRSGGPSKIAYPVSLFTRFAKIAGVKSPHFF